MPKPGAARAMAAAGPPQPLMKTDHRKILGCGTGFFSGGWFLHAPSRLRVPSWRPPFLGRGGLVMPAACRRRHGDRRLTSCRSYCSYMHNRSRTSIAELDCGSNCKPDAKVRILSKFEF